MRAQSLLKTEVFAFVCNKICQALVLVSAGSTELRWVLINFAYLDYRTVVAAGDQDLASWVSMHLRRGHQAPLLIG